MHHPGLMELARRDPRYAYEAYEFLFEALAHTQKRLNRVPPAEPTRDDELVDYHVSGPELVAGFCDLAGREFGRMARIVLHMWGIDRTDDVGAVVFNLIEASLLSKTDRDRREDFNDLFDLDSSLRDRFEIAMEREE